MACGVKQKVVFHLVTQVGQILLGLVLGVVDLHIVQPRFFHAMRVTGHENMYPDVTIQEFR